MPGRAARAPALGVLLGLWVALLLFGGPRAHAADEPDPRASALHVADGDSAYEAGRWKEAADCYWKAIEMDRTNYDAHVKYQRASLRQGVAVADLSADYDSFVRDFPADPAFKLHRARLDPPDARLKEIDALGGKATPADLAYETALALLEQDDTTKALKELESAVKKGATPRVEVLLVRTLARAGQSSEAEKRLKDRLDDPVFALEGARLSLATGAYDEAVKRADVVLAVRPASAAALLVRAEARLRTGHEPEAIEILTGARRATQDATPVLLALAGLLGHGPDPDKALPAAAELYDTVLKRDAKDTRAIYGMAWVLERQLKYKEAEDLYRKAASLLPTDASCVESIGFVLFRQGRVSDAAVQFKKAIDLDPDYASAYANLGAMHDEKAEYNEAIDWYEKLLKLRGQKDNIRALVNCAFDHEQLGNFSKAESYLRHAVAIRPKDADLVTWLADNLYFQEKWRDATKLYLQATDLDPKAFYAWRGLGLAFGQQNKWSDAADALEKAKQLKPKDLDLLLRLGGLYLQELENLDKALENFQAYEDNGGDDPAVPDTIAEIQKQIGDKKKH